MAEVVPYLAPNANPEWQGHEATRLQNMDELLAGPTTDVLAPVLRQIEQGAFLDIGAGTGTLAEQLCTRMGVDYYALDGNEPMLVSRQTTASDRKILANCMQMPFADGSFDATYTRTVTAWTPEPQQSIAEQLRITKPGGFAVFIEVDWSPVRATEQAGAYASTINAIRDVVCLTLKGAGFDTKYGGAQLATDIDSVAQATRNVYVRQERRYDLPPGNYSGVFMDVATNIQAMLKRVKMPGVALPRLLLDDALGIVKDHPECMHLVLPTIVAQTVHVRR